MPGSVKNNIATAKICELFRSIQGEGKYAGEAQVFVRFFECNMHCVWCDTPHSIGDTTRRFEEFSLQELCGRVRDLRDGCDAVSITGGEPLLQPSFLKIFLPALKDLGMTRHLETNGTLPDALGELINDVDVIAMDIKLPSSAKVRPYWDEHREFLRIARAKDTFIKIVVTSDTSDEDLRTASGLIQDCAPETLTFIQPNYFEMKNGGMTRSLRAWELCRSLLPNVRLLPQIHKFMKLR